MPKRGNDNLDDFFRKVSDLPDIPFNEEDWKKLEARLEAKEIYLRNARNRRNRLAGAVVLSVLLMSSYFWVVNHASQQPDKNKTNDVEAPRALLETRDVGPGNLKPTVIQQEAIPQHEVKSKAVTEEAASTIIDTTKPLEPSPGTKVRLTNDGFEIENSTEVKILDQDFKNEVNIIATTSSDINEGLADQVNKDKMSQEATQIVPVVTEENKQRANIQLPEAEDEEVRVSKVLGTDKAKLSASPRLSLLLSLAPDFSSTSFNDYSDPAGAVGLMIHYHIKSAWNISTGVVRSDKKYTGDGADYHPPKGYWKYYTNGIIPASVDGSCGVLEIPLMVQYTVASVGRSKFRVGAGASSYIMLDESYSYNFEEPNPGAREGWESSNNSGFFFNMINFTVAYEYQLHPRFMLGVEPYLKIPIEEIGWSNLKLFSTGASLTLRYNVLNKKNSTLSTRSRGPD